MASSTQPRISQLSTEDPILQHKAADAGSSDPDPDNSPQYRTFSDGSETSSRSSSSVIILERFEVDFDRNIHDRFKMVHDCIEGPLLTDLFNSGARKCSMAIRLMALGPYEAEAKPYIVVFTSQDHCKRIQRYFRRPTVRSIYKPSDPTNPSFEILVHGSSPEKKSNESEIEVFAPYCSFHSHYSSSTFCGTPIMVRHPSGHEICATLGGILKVDDENGSCELYGLTAGHVLDDGDDELPLPSINHEDRRSAVSWAGSDSDSDPGLDSDTETDSSSSMLINTDLLTAPKNDTQLLHQEPHVDPWSLLPQQRLGSVKKLDNHTSSGVETPTKVDAIRNLDWALIELHKYIPNRIPANPDSFKEGRELQAPCADDKKDFGLRAIMISGSERLKAGSISGLPSQLLLSPGTGFVDARIINLYDGKEVSDGDSGSWVVDGKTLEVYGHVVATDAFGGGYVIPIKDTMSDIQRNLNATSVSLPSTEYVSYEHVARKVEQESSRTSVTVSTSNQRRLSLPSEPMSKEAEKLDISSADYTPSTSVPQPQSQRLESPP
ncbi:hypothetical protein PG990_008033 [Apiospora arundinis]